MSFNETEFRLLAKETEATVIRLGTTSHEVLNRHKRYIEMLVDHLRSVNRPFDIDLCLEWVNSLPHDPAQMLNSSYVDWIALHRFIHLLEEQKNGTLTSWKHYLTLSLEMPSSADLCDKLDAFSEEMNLDGYKTETIKGYRSIVRRFLIYIESAGIRSVSEITNQNVIDYFKTDRFQNRSARGMQGEIGCLRKFFKFLTDHHYTDNQALPYALPRVRHPRERIITTIDEAIEKDLMEDKTDSLVNKRDQAILLLALHTGLRSCDIRALRFSDIDWEKETIHIKQKKTGVDLEIPIDSATQNAIIDYVLNERRSCDKEYIFVTAVGPAQKMARRHYRMKYRTRGTDSFERLPHDGLHIYRRTFASRLLQSGATLPEISEMLGHIDKSSVQVYLTTDEAKMKRCSLDLSLIPCCKEVFA